MVSRREFLERSLAGSSLFALGTTVPDFIASTAQAAETGKENVLVVLQMTGGNDGLNTVIPFADDLYYKARPTLGVLKNQVIRVDDHIGLHPSLRGLDSLLQQKQLAVVQGVGYPNPNRSHFESMDYWQTADPRGKTGNGWLGRTIGDLQVQGGRIPAFHMGNSQLPLALTGSATGVPSMNTEKPFGLDLIGDFYGHRPDGKKQRGTVRSKTVRGNDAPQDATEKKEETPSRVETRKQLIKDVAELAPSDSGGLLQFVKQTSLDTYASIDQLVEIMNRKFQVPNAQTDYSSGRYRRVRSGLQYELMLVARMIQAGFGTRIFYLSIDGFDTHSQQAKGHNQLLTKIGTAVSTFFTELKRQNDDKRVVLMTFSEFGRRVKENGSKGTDHGAGSCMFLAGPSVTGGPVGKHPSLAADELDSGDLRYHTDFRQVYATVLDKWLGCDSRRVLGGEFEHLKLFQG